MTEPLMDRRRAGELLREADCPEEFIRRFLDALELAPAEALASDTITRGDMAILICRAQDFMAWLQTL